LDFLGFPVRISKLKNDINYIKYRISHKFGKFVNDWTCIIQILGY
jgi:hypothetical protein